MRHRTIAAGSSGSSWSQPGGKPPPDCDAAAATPAKNRVLIRACPVGLAIEPAVDQGAVIVQRPHNSSDHQLSTGAQRSGSGRRQAVSNRSPSCIRTPSSQTRRLRPTSSSTGDRNRPHPSTHRASGAVAPNATTAGPGASQQTRSAQWADGEHHVSSEPLLFRGAATAPARPDHGACDCETFQSTPFVGPPGGVAPWFGHAP